MAARAVASAVILITLGNVFAGNQPSFCRRSECPRYKVAQTFQGYELREYEPSNWVFVQYPSVVEPFWEDRKNRSGVFMKLFKYISGRNDQRKKIKMTVPVLTLREKTKVSMGFFISVKLNSSIPQPTDPSIIISRREKMNVYVRSFGGYPYYAYRNYFKDNYNNLTASLSRDGKSYITDMFYTASYNRPGFSFRWHNEVWLLQEN